MDITIRPEIPPEVMIIVLSNLGRNDLLICRLVCNSWNNVCLMYLRNSKYTLLLDLKNIKSYVRFAKRNRKLVLPFHIHLDMNEYTRNYPNQFEINLKLLINWFGSECVVGLDLCSLVPGKDEMLIFLTEIFVIVSTRLKILDLKMFCMDPETVENFISKIKQRSIKFTNLKILKAHDPTQECSIVQFILENSPRLENLKVKYSIPTSIISVIHFGNLKSLAIGLFDISPSELLRKIQECQFLPILQKLKIEVDSNYEIENEIYHDILEPFSKTLKNLSIKFSGDRSVLPINFPKFPKLQCLKIKSYYQGEDLSPFLNPYDANFNPDTFPVLKYIIIPIGCFFMPEVSVEQLSLINTSSSTSLVIPIFKNITKLTINMKEWTCDKLMCQLCQKYVEHLQSVFPNVTSVVIMINSLTKEHVVKQLIKKLIQSDLASRLQNITFKNFEQDYLGQVLEQLHQQHQLHQPRLIIENVEKNSIYEEIIKNAFQSWSGLPDILSTTCNVLDVHNVEKQIITLEERNKHVDHKMTNIHTIKYEQCCRKNEMRRQMKSNELELALMVKHFPNLRQIGISSLIFDQDKQKCSEQIQNIRVQFPNITFNII